MPATRLSRLDPEVRARILAAASAEFVARGFHSASYNRIIQDSGLSKGSIYYYFESKEDLFLTLVQDRLLQATSGLTIEPPSEGFWTWFHTLSDELTERCMRQPDLIPLGRDFHGLLGGGRSAQATQLFEALRTWTERILAVGQEQGAVRDDLPLSLLAQLTLDVGQTLDRWALTLPHEQMVEEVALLTNASFDLFRRLLQP